jgi:DNA-binding transcriptional LysR family regulator
MELRHLRYFVAVAEELNYRKASERLHLAPPALSHQIKCLEEELGFQLFDRDTGGVRLTDAGKVFLAGARLTLAQSQQTVSMAADAAAGNRGQLTVGYVEPVLMGFMPACLMAFHGEYPNVEVVLKEMPIEDQIAALESGVVQIGFAVDDVSHLPQGLRHALIVHSPIRAIMARTNPLAALPEVTMDDLARERLLCLTLDKNVDSLHAELVRRHFAAHGLKLGPIRQVEGPEAFRAALESGIGVSLIAEIGGISRSQALVTKAIRGPGSDGILRLHALWRGDGGSRIVANFVELMQKLAPGKMSRRKGS